MKINVHEAKTQLSRLIAKAEAGEEVIIARHGKPVARRVPFEAVRPKRRAGSMKGKIWLDDSFFDPLPEEELRAWEGGGDRGCCSTRTH
jgi:prevent-host-death family protein